MVAIILRWAADDDDGAAWNALASLQLGDDVTAAVAELACELVERGYTESGSGFRAIQQVVRFYQSAGASGLRRCFKPARRGARARAHHGRARCTASDRHTERHRPARAAQHHARLPTHAPGNAL